MLRDVRLGVTLGLLAATLGLLAAPSLAETGGAVPMPVAVSGGLAPAQGSPPVASTTSPVADAAAALALQVAARARRLAPAGPHDGVTLDLLSPLTLPAGLDVTLAGRGAWLALALDTVPGPVCTALATLGEARPGGSPAVEALVINGQMATDRQAAAALARHCLAGRTNQVMWRLRPAALAPAADPAPAAPAASAASQAAPAAFAASQAAPAAGPALLDAVPEQPLDPDPPPAELLADVAAIAALVAARLSEGYPVAILTPLSVAAQAPDALRGTPDTIVARAGYPLIPGPDTQTGGRYGIAVPGLSVEACLRVVQAALQLPRGTITGLAAIQGARSRVVIPTNPLVAQRVCRGHARSGAQAAQVVFLFQRCDGHGPPAPVCLPPAR